MYAIKKLPSLYNLPRVKEEYRFYECRWRDEDDVANGEKDQTSSSSLQMTSPSSRKTEQMD